MKIISLQDYMPWSGFRMAAGGILNYFGTEPQSKIVEVGELLHITCITLTEVLLQNS